MYHLPEGRRPRAPAAAALPSTPSSAKTQRVVTPVSLSAPPPFDWEAARGNKPAPFASPVDLRKKAITKNVSQLKGGQKVKAPKVYRRVPLAERVTNLLDPSQWWYEITMLPTHLPLPPAHLLGRAFGVAMNVAHLSACWGAMRAEARRNDSAGMWAGELGWDEPGDSGWGWTLLFALFTLVAFGNAAYVATRTRIYRLHLAQDPVPSSHATFVPADLSLEPTTEPPISARLGKGLLASIITTWRFLVGSPAPSLNEARKFKSVQQLQMWNPGEGELSLLCFYSPIHALLYDMTPSLYMALLLLPVSFLLFVLISAYTALLKDRAILASEVLHEYDQTFVYPRLNPIKKDAETMTHEAEMVDYWRR